MIKSLERSDKQRKFDIIAAKVFYAHPLLGLFYTFIIMPIIILSILLFSLAIIYSLSILLYLI